MGLDDASYKKPEPQAAVYRAAPAYADCNDADYEGEQPAESAPRELPELMNYTIGGELVLKKEYDCVVLQLESLKRRYSKLASSPSDFQIIEHLQSENDKLAKELAALKEADKKFQYFNEGRIKDLTAERDRYKAALVEAQQHFDSIASGLTTDIKRVEMLTKDLARKAAVEIREALKGKGL